MTHPAIEYMRTTILRDEVQMQELRDFCRVYINGVKSSGYRARVELDRRIMCMRFFVRENETKAQAAMIFVPNLLDGSVDPIMIIEDAVLAMKHLEGLCTKATQAA